MNQDYSEPIRAVFPQAMHHECVFHALQWSQRLVKEIYGNDYAQTHPEAVVLKGKVYHIFKAKSRKTVNERYREVMALKEEYVAQMPYAQRIFDLTDASAASDRSPASCAGSCWAGRLKPSRSLSQRRNAPSFIFLPRRLKSDIL